MTGFKLRKEFIRRGNEIKIDFILSVAEVSHIMAVIKEYGGNYGQMEIKNANDFRCFIKDVISSKCLAMEEGRY